MSDKNKEIYEFGEFRLDVTERFLMRSDGERVRLSDKAFETLCALVQNGGHLVSKNELLKRVWADSFVEENNLNKCIHIIRRALGEKTGERQFVETIKKHGFRFVAEVRRVGSEETADVLLQNQSSDSTGTSRRSEAVENKPTETVSTLSTGSEESIEQTTELNRSHAKFDGKGKHSLKYRLPFAAFALAASLVATLGYYFWSIKTAPSMDGKKTIAVLPLKPINTLIRDEIYEIGIAESLIHRLSSSRSLIVRPLSATRRYADIEQDPFAAGREQQVDYVLSANYQLAGGKIKVTAQLLNAANGQIEETHKIEKYADDVFAMQDAIAVEMSNKLLWRFPAAANNLTAARHGTTNQEAYRLYLQGRNLTERQTAADARKAVQYFEQAIQLDANFARGYSGIARAYLASGIFGASAPRAEFEKAREAINKALELDNNLAEVYAARGELKLLYEWDFIGAEDDLLRAIEMEPNNDLAHWVYANLLAYNGRFDDSLAEIETTLAISPGSLAYQRDRGRILYYARRFDEAIVQLKRVVELDESFWTALSHLWLAYEMKGDYVEAYESFMKRQKRLNPERVEIYQKAYETAGWYEVRRKLLEFDKLNEHQPGSNLFAIARQCALLGEKEQAFEYLNKAAAKRQMQTIMLNIEPAFDSLRDDPRFDELVRRVGLK